MSKFLMDHSQSNIINIKNIDHISFVDTGQHSNFRYRIVAETQSSTFILVEMKDEIKAKKYFWDIYDLLNS